MYFSLATISTEINTQISVDLKQFQGADSETAIPLPLQRYVTTPPFFHDPPNLCIPLRWMSTRPRVHL